MKEPAPWRLWRAGSWSRPPKGKPASPEAPQGGDNPSRRGALFLRLEKDAPSNWFNSGFEEKFPIATLACA